MASTRLTCIAVCIQFLYCNFAHAAIYTVEALEGEKGVALVFDIPIVPSSIPLIKIEHIDTSSTVAFVFSNTLLVRPFEGGLKERLIFQQPDVPNRRVTITLKNVNASDAGSYKCFSGSTTTEIDGCGVMLIIVRKPNPPKVVLTSGNVVGMDLVLRCKDFSTSLPQSHGLTPLVEWWLSDLDTNRISENNDTLVFSNIQREDEGKVFRCRAADMTKDETKRLMSEYSSDFVLAPEFGPSTDDIKLTPYIPFGGTHSVALASSLNVSCTVTCVPQCDVFWEFKAYAKDSFSPAPNDYSSGGRLGISSVLAISHGQFRCVGTNSHGRVEHDFYLNVLYMLTPIAYVNGEKKDVGVTFEGDGDVVLRCDVGSNPEPRVSWYAPDNRDLRSSKLEGPKPIISENNNVLIHWYTSKTVLRDLRCSDSGSYQCRSETREHVTMSTNITMDVNCKPRTVSYNAKGLKKDYVWEIGSDLYVEFLVEAWPKPVFKHVESENNDILKRENPADIDVSLQPNYDRKPYWTLVQFRSKRTLTFEDNGRAFIITLENQDYKVDFTFTIHAKGPPHAITNTTVDKITHNSAHLSWLPGFNGGETQKFFVMMMQKRPQDLSAHWVAVVSNISNDVLPNQQRLRAVVEDLAPSTEYTLRIMGLNSLGNTTTDDFVIKTLSAPASSMAGGAIAAIVITVLIIIIIAVVVFYIFIYRKRWGKGGGALKPQSKIRAVYRHFKGQQNGSGGDTSKVAPKDRKPIFLGKAKASKGKAYANVPTENTDPTLLEDDYANANEISAPMLNEPIYSNVTPKAERKPANGGGGDEAKNNKDLHYASIDFSRVKPTKADKKLKKQKEQERKEEEVTYSDINIERTKAKQLEMEREEEEGRALSQNKVEQEEEEDPYMVVNNGPGTAV